MRSCSALGDWLKENDLTSTAKGSEEEEWYDYKENEIIADLLPELNSGRDTVLSPVSNGTQLAQANVFHFATWLMM
ncbi:hypothetical protein RB195_015075 [Necator americanus]|uniref:Uncharacterized protein n=1 Tax=Necator americanus TaxID=51031 RepID=A0ABR1E3C6_NECAM